MGLSKTIQKWKDTLSTPKPTTQHPPKPVKPTQSEEDLVSMQLLLPRAPHQPYPEAALHRPTSQIVCHSPLDKRNKPKKPKKGGVVEVQGVGFGDGKKYATSKVLFSSTTRSAVEIKPTAELRGLGKGEGSSGHSLFSAESIRL